MAIPCCRINFIIVWFILFALTAVTSFGQTAKSRNLNFTAAKKTVTRTGTIFPGKDGKDTAEFTFKAKKGQKIKVALKSNKVRLGEDDYAGAVFFILDENQNTPPDFGDYPYGGPKNWAGALTKTGDYRIRVAMEMTSDFEDLDALKKLDLVIRYSIRVTLD